MRIRTLGILTTLVAAIGIVGIMLPDKEVEQQAPCNPAFQDCS